MRASYVLVLLLCVCTMQTSGFVFPSGNNRLFPMLQPQHWPCRASDGSEGICMSLISGGCPLYTTTAHLLLRRPNICAMGHRDAIVCCPLAVFGSGRGGVTQQPPTTRSTTRAPFRATWPPFRTFRPIGTTQPPFIPTPPPTRPTQPPTRPTPPPTRPTQPPTRPTQPPTRPTMPSTRPITPVVTKPPERVTAPPSFSRPPTPPNTLAPWMTSSPAPVSSTRDLNSPIGLRPRPSVAPIVVAPKPGTPRGFRQPGCGIRNPIPAFHSSQGYTQRRPLFVPSTFVQLGMHPWTALVGVHEHGSSDVTRWICAGALLTPRIVLTSAQCVMSAGNQDDLLVGLGEHDLTSSTDGQAGTHRVLAVEFHKEWSQPQRRHSLALLLLNRPADNSQLIRPVCLPPPDPVPAPRLLQPAPDSSLTEVAYDLDSTGMDDASARQRLEARGARVAPLRACVTVLEGLPLTDLLFPGGPQPESDLCLVAGASCAMDVGAPVVVSTPDGTFQLEGLELLDSCAPNKPRLLLRVRHYVPFIAETIEKLLKGGDSNSA